jgi:hypothetical protein
MQHYNSDPQPWYIVPVKPGADAQSRRWNLVIISILAALVLGFFFALIIPETGNTAHKAPGKIHGHQPIVSIG